MRAQAMIGPDIEMRGEGLCMYKEGGGGMEKSLHQDAPYSYHRDHSFCTAFVHLVPTTEENGCLRVMPGSGAGLTMVVEAQNRSRSGLDFALRLGVPLSGRD